MNSDANFFGGTNCQGLFEVIYKLLRMTFFMLDSGSHILQGYPRIP